MIKYPYTDNRDPTYKRIPLFEGQQLIMSHYPRANPPTWYLVQTGQRLTYEDVLDFPEHFIYGFKVKKLK